MPTKNSASRKGGGELKKNYYVFSSGTIKRKDNTVAIEKEGAKRKFLPVEKIESLYLFGEINLNTRLLSFLSQKEVSLHVYSHKGWYSGMFFPKRQRISGKLIVEQVKAVISPPRRLAFAREFINGATHNIIRVIQRAQGRLEEASRSMEKLKQIKAKLYYAATVNEIMAVEGEFRQEYYPILAKICDQEYNGRIKQPPLGKLNCLISFGNTLLYTRTLNKIYQTQLDPTISYLHEPCEMRFSLSLDISEVFRPVIVDRMIIELLNSKALNDDDFDQDMNSTLLNEIGRKKVIDTFEKWLETTIMYPKLKRKVSYDTMIRLECYKIIRSLLCGETYQSLHMWW